MSEDNEEKPPIFKSQVPGHLLHGKTRSEIWIYESLDIARQQNHHIMEQQITASKHRVEIHKRLDDVDARLKPIEKAKIVITAKWSVVAFILSGLLSIALMIMGAWISANWFLKHG